MSDKPKELDLNQKENQPVVKDRPLAQRILALVLIGIVLFGFLGTCYWLAFYGV